MSISEICKRRVVFTEKEDSVLEAARVMRQHHVGDLVVVDARDGRRGPVGIVTDRDIVIEVVAKKVDPESVTVNDIMSRELVTVNEHDGIYETISLMRNKGVRRVPVVDNKDTLIGIVSIDDLLELLADEITELSCITSQARSVEAKTRA